MYKNLVEGKIHIRLEAAVTLLVSFIFIYIKNTTLIKYFYMQLQHTFDFRIKGDNVKDSKSKNLERVILKLGTFRSYYDLVCSQSSM